MLDFKDPEYVRFVAFDWFLSDERVAIGDRFFSSYDISDWLSKVCVGGNLGCAVQLLVQENAWSTAQLPRYGLHIVFLLALMGDVARLLRFAEHVSTIRQLFAVPVAVQLSSSQEAKDNQNWNIRYKPVYKSPTGKKFIWKYPIDIALESHDADVVDVLLDWMAAPRGTFIPSIDMTDMSLRLVKKNSRDFRKYFEFLTLKDRYNRLE